MKGSVGFNVFYFFRFLLGVYVKASIGLNVFYFFSFRFGVYVKWPLPSSDFANYLDPDQARQNVGPGHLDPNCLTL